MTAITINKKRKRDTRQYDTDFIVELTQFGKRVHTYKTSVSHRASMPDNLELFEKVDQLHTLVTAVRMQIRKINNKLENKYRKHMKNELNEPVWAVVTHDKVIDMGITYKEAEHVVKLMGKEAANEATIVTITAASKMIFNEKARQQTEEAATGI